MSGAKKVMNPIETAEEMARKIWLAGLGAYGKSFEEIQNQYEKLNSETSRRFEELVEKGAKLEADTKKKIKKQTSTEKRVDELRKKLTGNSSDIENKINDLSQKVDELTVAVSKLTS